MKFVVGIYNPNGQIAQAVPVTNMAQAEARREFFEAKFAEDGPYEGFIVRVFMLGGNESPPQTVEVAPEPVEIVEVVVRTKPSVFTAEAVRNAHATRTARIAAEERTRLDRLVEYDESCGFCDGCAVGAECDYADDGAVEYTPLRSERVEREVVPTTPEQIRVAMLNDEAKRNVQTAPRVLALRPDAITVDESYVPEAPRGRFTGERTARWFQA